jgi:hypothetical protein
MQCLLVILNANLITLISVVTALFYFNRLMFNYCFIDNGTPSLYAPLHNCLFKGVCEWLCPVHPGNNLPINKCYVMDIRVLFCPHAISRSLTFYFVSNPNVLSYPSTGQRQSFTSWTVIMQLYCSIS